MSDWQKGDLALCIKVGEWRRLGEFGDLGGIDNGPRAGMTLTVSEVLSFGNGQALKFVDFPDQPEAGWKGYNTTRFRKITPDKADEYDREVIDLMAGKKVPA